MWRVLLSVVVLVGGGPAWASDDAPMATYRAWQILSDPSAPGIAFAEGAGFLRAHPGWPEEKSLRLRTEAAALRTGPPRAAMTEFCRDFPPISGRGMIACMRGGAGDAKTMDSWLHQGWLQGDFSSTEEDAILKEYGSKLTRADHVKRVDRLLFEGKVTPAKRLMGLTGGDRRALYEARIALITDAKTAPRKLFAVPVNQHRDAGLLFDRLNWRIRHHQENQLAEIFAVTPRVVPYPDLWWPARAIAAREALAKRNFNLALSILDGHGDLKSEALADALWLKGWVILQYRHDPGEAYKQFFSLYTSVGTPVSKARAAYWAARAAIRNGNPDIAHEWMEKAARHPTVFYGQLAHLSLNPTKPLPLPDNPTFTAQEKDTFDGEELVQVTRALAKQDDKKMAELFLLQMAGTANAPSRFALLADLAREIGDTADAVRVAKLALRKGVVMVDAGWPRIELPQGLGTEPALALAISRQESEFDPLARSTADARGMMQLLPSTAKHVADKNGLSYGRNTLDDPIANVTLGTAYLGQIINGFDGSYILGIASYNAGPGNARGWIAARGRPPKNLNDAVDWIESIPFAETRNYVMRVLENVQIYRSIAAPDKAPHLAKDLVR